MQKTGLIKGPSHNNGGIGITIKETGTHKEVEGQEYLICTKAFFSTEIHEFTDKTNKEILDRIHKLYGCPTFNPEVSATDFVLCKLVVNDTSKHTRTGTVKEILNIMQREKSCTVSEGTQLENGGPAAAEACGCTHEQQLAKGGSVETDQQIIDAYPKLNPKEADKVFDTTMYLINEGRELTAADKKIIEQYEGRGNRYEGEINEGMVHQFYTPYIITKKMWDLAKHYGFTGGNVTEPSCGTGRFFKFAPEGTNLFGFDLDDTNIKIAKALYPNVKLYKQEFETAFLKEPMYNTALKKSWLPEMDLVIGNPPYGDYAGYYKTYMPSIYKRFEFLFIRKGLELLKQNGLLIYIISQNLMNNGAMYNKMKENILDIGTFVDAYRLPNGIFTSTQVGTDIVIFKRK